MKKAGILAPLKSLRWVDRDDLNPNDYNPNVVNRRNLDLLVKSIMSNGWTLPIVVREDLTIIDGFHRWTVAGEEPLVSILGGKVPVVTVAHSSETEAMAGTVTHNRARGVHLVEPMQAIVKRMLDDGVPAEEIGSKMGMTKEEVFRLSPMTREQFLELMSRGKKDYDEARLVVRQK